MKQKLLYPIWAILYIMCICLGAIPNAQRSNAGQWVLTALSILCFVPGFWLLTRAVLEKDRKTLLHLRLISAISLGATALAMVLNILSAFWSEAWGVVMHVILLFVSAPMLCWGSVGSLLLWAVLLFATFPKMWKI